MINIGNKNHQIYHEDCFKILDQLIKNNIKVDAIICDMPFGVTNNKWDKKLDLDQVWSRLKKIRKHKLVPILLFADKKAFETELYLSNKEWYRYEWTWDKLISTGFLDVAYKPMMHLEKILVFIEKPFIQIKSKHSWKKYDRVAKFYPQYTIGKPNHSSGKSLKNNNTTYGKFKTQNEIKKYISKNETYGSLPKISNTYNTSFYKENMWRISSDKTFKHPKQLLVFRKDKSNQYTKNHPTAKPVALIEYLVKTYTHTGATILDFCAGGGSLLVACKNTNRKSILIEKEKKYIEMIKGKLNEN